MSVKRYDVMSYSLDVEGNLGPFVKYEDYAALEARYAALAAESSTTNERLQRLIQIINNADNSYCMCGEAMETHTHGGCGHPTGMFDYHYDKWLESVKQTPATSAFLAEVRAQGVERLANAWYTIANETDPGISISDSSRLKYRQRADDAADFANEIRQEAAQ